MEKLRTMERDENKHLALMQQFSQDGTPLKMSSLQLPP
jgi:hypothetical protein